MNMRSSRSGRSAQCAGTCQRGQSTVEYLIVVSLFVLAFALGPDSALELLVRAVAFRYQMFTFAMSQP